MRTQFWAALAALIFTVAASAPARAADTLARTRLQTFVVEVCNGAGNAAIGSGVVVDRRGDVLTLATAAHVVSQPGTLRILDASRQAYYDVLSTQLLPQYDLALVQIRAQDAFPVAPVEFAEPRAGQSVWVWGNTGEGLWQVANGSVRNTSAEIPGIWGAARITIECAACAPGDSGSGVFDERGRLLGILTRAWRKAAGGPVLFIEVEPAAVISKELLANR